MIHQARRRSQNWQQSSAATGGLQVRIGVHTGDVVHSDDYLGLTVHKTDSRCTKQHGWLQPPMEARSSHRRPRPEWSTRPFLSSAIRRPSNSKDSPARTRSCLSTGQTNRTEAADHPPITAHMGDLQGCRNAGLPTRLARTLTARPGRATPPTSSQTNTPSRSCAG
jgi:hypothetical protein